MRPRSLRRLPPVAFIVLLLAAALLGCARPEAAEESAAPLREWGDGRLRMGTVLDVRVVGRDPAAARAFIEDVFRAVEALESEISSHREDSPVSDLNRRRVAGSFGVPRALGCALSRALALSTMTAGAFDPSVGPLVDLYRQAAERGSWPSEREIALARARVGARRIHVSGCERVMLDSEGMRLDFGGVGKGLALEAVRARWRAAPPGEGALVSFGQSSLLALGRPVDGSAWRLALHSSGEGAPPLGRLALSDLALGFSSSAGQGVEIAGRRASHVIDPRSGLPVAGVVEAAVVAPDAGLADAFSTALVVLAPGVAEALVEATTEVEALIVRGAGSRYESPGLRALTGYEPPREGATR